MEIKPIFRSEIVLDFTNLLLGFSSLQQKSTKVLFNDNEWNVPKYNKSTT